MVLIIKFISVYLIGGLILGFIPVNLNKSDAPIEKTIFVASNGVHTDIILPLHETNTNWRKFLNNPKLHKIWPAATHISFGWGDLGFYLNTPEWKDLKVQTAFNAMFLESPSAMHVTLINQPQAYPNIRMVKLNNKQFGLLEDYIKLSFKQSLVNNAILVNHPGYGVSDAFFESDRSFNLFNTCNVWTNSALKKAGIRTSVWSPFDKPILYHLSRANH